MIDFQMDVAGAKRVSGRLKKMGGRTEDILDRSLERRLPNVVEQRLAGSQQYPKPPRASGYVRTYALAGGWFVRRVGVGRYRIGNTQRYARYVVGDNEGKGQATMHRYRWWLARRRIDRETPALLKGIEQDVREEWNRL